MDTREDTWFETTIGAIVIFDEIIYLIRSFSVLLWFISIPWYHPLN